MKIIKLIIGLLFACGLLSSCIERYYSGYDSDFKPQVVIEGTICPDEGMQEIRISITSSPDDPKFIPLSGCVALVEDDKGNQFRYSELNTPGHYMGAIDGDKVIIGSKYRLQVTTPQGKQYRSSFEELLPCPPIDSVYFELTRKPTSDPDNTLNGLQFYVNFKANENYGHYYRLEAVETYEYHSRWPLQEWNDEHSFPHRLEDADSSNFVCYKTTKLRNIFELSTEGFTQNSYPHYPLHYVKDQSKPLMIKYSLLVNQYSMDKKAYIYWGNLRKNNQEATDLFGKQPLLIKGNIYNVNDTADIALGYFGVSTIQSKRIMVHPFGGLHFDKAFVCRAMKIYGFIPKGLVYFATDFDNGAPYKGFAGAECIFCQLYGGDLIKPPYWDEQ